MVLYPLFRLLWRPMTLPQLVWIGMLLPMVLFAPRSPFRGPPDPNRIDLFTLVIPVFVGLIVGRALGEVQHTLFGWTLPDIRRKLLFSVLLTGGVTALLVTYVYSQLGGTAPVLPVSTSVLLWFSMGTIYSTGETLGSTSRPVRLIGFSLPTLVVLVVAGANMTDIAGLYTSRPLLSASLTLLGAFLCLYRIFDVAVARGKSIAHIAGPRPSIRSILGREGIKAERETSGPRSKLGGPLMGFADWFGAGRYENFGRHRGGWLAALLGHACLAACVVTALAYVNGYLRESHELGIRFAYEAIFETQILHKGRSLFYAFIAILAFGISMMLRTSLCLRKGWHYPLSRDQRLRLVYWGSLLHTVALSMAMALVFAVAGGAICLYAGYGVDFGTDPGFLRPLALLSILAPAVQWVRLRYDLSTDRKVSTVFFLFLPFVIALGILWPGIAQGLPGIYEAAALLGLVLLSQCIYYVRLKIHFAREDLV